MRPPGLFFFHTFNRNFASWLVVIKGVEWFVKNTPRDMHILERFLKPAEVSAACRRSGLQPCEVFGSRPKLGAPFWHMIRTGTVPDDFEFLRSRSTHLGYTGYARKVPL